MPCSVTGAQKTKELTRVDGGVRYLTQGGLLQNKSVSWRCRLGEGVFWLV